MGTLWLTRYEVWITSSIFLIRSQPAIDSTAIQNAAIAISMATEISNRSIIQYYRSCHHFCLDTH